VRELSDTEIAWKEEGTRSYQQLALRSLQTLVETTPLTEIEPNRPKIDADGLAPLYQVKQQEQG
jgi:phenylacetic acid degradation protein